MVDRSTRTRGNTTTGTETHGGTSTGTEFGAANRVLLLAIFAAQLGCGGDPIRTPSPPGGSSGDASVAEDATPVALDTGVTDRGTTDAAPTPLDATASDAEPLPCMGQTCGVNATCNIEHDQCVCNDGYEGDPIAGCTEAVMGSGWIGSPCTDDSQCDYPDGVCQTDGEGYPSGHCSQACTRYCPDREDHAVTFCVQPPASSDGGCFARCDTMIHPSNMGCRVGYRCQTERRFNEPAVSRAVCVPESWSPPDQCADPRNHAQDDDCWFDLISFGDATAEALARRILSGAANSAEAEQWLDLNYEGSQRFITDDLGRTIHDNFSRGHRSDRPMNGMIVHYTAAQREDGTIRYFVGSSPHASTHFVVGSERNGLIVQIFSHRNRTWHAGSTYNVDRFGFDFANAGYLEPRSGGGYNDYADRRYGMDLALFGDQPVEITDGIPGAHAKYARKDYWQPYTYHQVLAFLLVSRALHLVYNLESDRIERHGDVASSRVDPGPAMPLTASKALIFDTSDVFSVDWLMRYKTEADWIVRNPQAR